MAEPWRPTREELAAAVGRTISDVVAPDLAVLFCGINPSLYSGAVGHHFARPGNRFWKALHLSGFTDRELSPFEDTTLLRYGLGVTNLVPRTTAAADELADEELREGARRVEALVRRLRPRVLVVLGTVAYRKGFGEPNAVIGEQPSRIDTTAVWLLPNPSGRTAAYQLPDLVELFGE
ncbi:MAG TPA: G/U mismatch-specific DNA glycosylase, partial [Actinomycetota bacterium]|nr:G/U mismatch-specific DNA glycosylase [Actinomycetota bacterium]